MPVLIKYEPMSERYNNIEHPTVKINVWCIGKDREDKPTYHRCAVINGAPTYEDPQDAIDWANDWLEDKDNVKALVDMDITQIET